MIDIAHFFVLITDQGHKSQLQKTVEFKLLPYFTAMLTQRLPKVTFARKQDYSIVSLYFHYSAATSFRLNELWLPPIRPLSHILLSEPGTELWYVICLVSCEMHWQSVCQPLLLRLNKVAAIPTAQAAEEWAVAWGEGGLWIYNSSQQFYKRRLQIIFFYLKNINNSLIYTNSEDLPLKMHQVYIESLLM